MAIVAQRQQGVFTVPTNGTPGNADEVRGNDNTLRATYNGHDADPQPHVQMSVLASRPAPGTAERLWITTDGLRAYVDTGAAWAELAYLPLVGGTVAGTVTATLFSGSGASLTALPAGQLTGTVDTARLSGSYTGITGLGTLGSLTVSGTATAALFSGSGASLTALPAGQLTGTVPNGALAGSYTGLTALTASGTITAGLFSGSGASLTALPAGQLTGTVASARLTGAYTGITDVGTLGSLTVTGTATAALFSGSGASLTSLPAGQLTGTVASARISGAYTGITQVGTLTGLTVTGTATATTFSGSGASLTALPAAELTGTVASARLSGAYTGITSLGTLTGLTVSGTAALARADVQRVIWTRVTASGGASYTPDAATGSVFEWTASGGGARTFNNPTNGVVGQEIILIFNNTDAGGAIASFGSAYRIDGAAVVTTASGFSFTGRFVYDGTVWRLIGAADYNVTT